ncbi:MAG: hypothetical protein JSU07_07660 [Bacteroidetes bacterium]|nr:hypothetical protein [Bacteroidota bacterium]
MLKIFHLILFLIVVVFLPAQNTAPKKENALFTIRGNAGIPRTISSSMFHGAFNGVYEGGLSINAKVFDNFFVGLGYENINFLNQQEVFVYYRAGNGSLSYNTHLINNAGFIKLGYDKFFSQIGYMSYSLNAGLMYCKYTNVINDTNSKNAPYPAANFITPYLQPEMSVNFIVDQHLSFNIFLSYTTMLTKFDPKMPRFNQVDEVRSRGNNYLMSYFTFGFGFNILINKRQKN